MAQVRRNPFWLIVVIAVGFCAYGAYAWVNVDEPSPKLLAFSVEANYEADLARMRADTPDGKLNISDDWKAKHREAVREEILASIKHEKDLARSWFVIGLALLIFSLGRIFAQPLFDKNK